MLAMKIPSSSQSTCHANVQNSIMYLPKYKTIIFTKYV